MSTFNPFRVASSRSAMWALVTAANACTLTDYSYLGAQRDALNATGGYGGESTSLSAKGGTSGAATNTRTGSAGGDSGGRSDVPSLGGTAGSATSSGTQGGIQATTIASGGSSEIPTVTGGTTSTFAAGGETSASTTGGALDVGGSVAAGGVTTVTSTNTQTDAGTSSTAGASGMGGDQATGGVITGGGTSATLTGYSTSSGGAGAGGSLASGGSSSTGGTTASINSSTGLPISCNGCAVLSVPFNTKGQVARFLMLFTPSVSVTSASILRVRAFAQTLGNTQYQLFIQQDSGSYTICLSGQLNLPSGIASSWVTLDFALSSCSANTNIGRLGLELMADTAPSAPTPNNTQLWIDSIWIEANGYGVAGPFNFDTSSTVNANSVSYDYNQSYGSLYLRPSNPTPPSGSTLWWRNG